MTEHATAFPLCRCCAPHVERTSPANQDRPALRWTDCSACGRQSGPVEFDADPTYPRGIRPALASMARAIEEPASC